MEALDVVLNLKSLGIEYGTLVMFGLLFVRKRPTEAVDQIVY